MLVGQTGLGLGHIITGIVALVAFVPLAAFSGEPCPSFSEIALATKISPSDRAAQFDGGAVGWLRELRIDTDGSAVSYHPENIGTTHLCNGMNPYIEGRCLGVSQQDLAQCYDAVRKAQQVGWERQKSPPFCIYGFEVNSRTRVGDKLVWGGEHGDGPIPLQQENDPAPGFFISQTAAPLPVRLGASRVSAYADADRVPYVVVPGSFVGNGGPTQRRAAAAVVAAEDLHVVRAIVGDTGKNLGEVSVAAAQLIHDRALTMPVPITERQLRDKMDLPYPYAVRRGNVRVSANPHEGPYLIFVFSKRYGVAREYSQAQADALANTGFQNYGDAEHLGRCAKEYFEETERSR